MHYATQEVGTSRNGRKRWANMFEIRETLDILCLLWLVPYSISKRLCLNVRCSLFLYLIIITYSVITEIIEWDLFKELLIS